MTKNQGNQEKLKVGAANSRLLRKIKQRYDKNQGCQEKIK